ncbi:MULTISPECIES: thioesterase domain-containing protein [unclassified Kitasatospora]|uniref:thioesterase II family protein n=1 Tax=unclassified Kitasatospora TaxID=2633591 RepID=UPI0033E883E2
METTKSRSPRWVVTRPQRPAARVRLFCFPYAGGGTSVFRSWHEFLDPSVEVCPVLLPGREERISEPPATVMADLVVRLAEHLEPWTDKPFAFFGHSMGGQIAFALTRLLAERGARTPTWLFLGGCVPQRTAMRRHLLPDAELTEEIRQMNGMPTAVLNDPEILALLLPVLRADFALTETYLTEPGVTVPVPMTTFAGVDDAEARPADMKEWARHCAGPSESLELPGDHFFLNEPAAMLDLVNRRLRTVAARS